MGVPLFALILEGAVPVHAIPDSIPVEEAWVVTTTHFSGYETKTLRDEMSPHGTHKIKRKAGKYYC